MKDSRILTSWPQFTIALWVLLSSSWAPQLGYCAQASAPTTVLDLSHKHFLEAQTLEEAIRASSWDMADDARPERLKVDISRSLLGDEKGFQQILRSLLPKDDSVVGATTTTTTGISFVSRGNRMTPKSLDGLFQILLSSSSPVIATTNATTDGDQNTTQSTTTSDDASAAKDTEQKTRPWVLTSLDVGWNGLQPQASGWKSFLKSLQKLLESPDVCPQCIRFERCGLSPGACRAIGKGIINRYGKKPTGSSTAKPLSLHLCGNADLGDSGSAAIAAAIRTVITEGTNSNGVILDTLDLSGCDIGDAGAEALALALEKSVLKCIRHLDLSNNKISDVGASAISHALLASGADGKNGPLLESLDLSGNKDIKDEAATAIAEAVGKGYISCIRLRSCHVLADGAASFGKAIASLAKRTTTPAVLQIDLSGNPLGVLRGKSKKGRKYSASAIKSKASATTAAYMSMLQKGIKRGLKEYGVDVLGNGAESDDDEEERNGLGDDLVGDEDSDPSKARCGIKAFSNAFLDESADESESANSPTTALLKCEVGIRRCFLDHGAADALAAVIVHSKDETNVDLSLDVALNPVLEEEMTAALQGDEEQDDLLREMSERYLDALEALRELRERGAEAARAAAARIQADADFEAQWDVPVGFDDEDMWEEEWDSDADYEQEEDEYY